jgi:hypothetical protein
MTPAWRPALEHQFAAALDMLENAIRACPGAAWDDASLPVSQRFWYLAYHTLFWLDYYLAEREDEFAPPSPYTLGETDPAGVYPEHAYAPSQLLGYLEHGRERLRRVLASLTEARAAEPCGFSRCEMSVLELQLYSLRHVQHHAAQLNLLLRQRTNSAPGWVGKGTLGLERT